MNAHVFVSGQFAGTLEKTETETGFRHTFTYEKNYLAVPNAIPVSTTMPLSAEPYISVDLHHPFNGLIPEGWLLDFAVRTLQIERLDRFQLLQMLCRDNIGALEIIPDGRKNHLHELSKPVEIETITGRAPRRLLPVCMSCLESLPASGHNANFHEKCSQKLFGTPNPPTPAFADEYLQTYAERAIRNKMSLSGVQPKFPGVFKISNRESIVLPGQFIFKPEPENSQFRDLPYFELLGMVLCERMKIPTAERGIIFSDAGRPIYITRRFDRRPEKIHTEDMAQILNRTYSDDKYSGSLEMALSKLREISGPFKGIASERFVKLCLLNYLLLNSDNHHKNHSVVILPPGRSDDGPRVTLAPAYDILPTAPFINDHDQLALSICGKKSNITKKNWETFFERASLPKHQVERFVQTFSQEIPFMKAGMAALGIEDQKSSAFLKEVHRRIELLN